MAEAVPDEAIEDWPIYIGDMGRVVCYHPDCPEDDDWDWAPIGRRTTVGAFLAELRRHASQDHGLHLT